MHISDNTYENIGFPENIPYDLRSIIKQECDWFIRYANMLDQIALNCLLQIYYNSIEFLFEDFN